MYFAYGERELSYLRQKDKRLGAVIDRIGQIDRAVDPNLHESAGNHLAANTRYAWQHQRRNHSESRRSCIAGAWYDVP